MFSLIVSAIVFNLVSYEENDSSIFILFISIILLFPGIIYLFNQIAGRVSTNFLGVFSVSTNFWCILSLVLSIEMGTGTVWSFTQIINHPYTPISSLATFSDYSLALSYNSFLLLLIFFISYLSPVQKINAKINFYLVESIKGFSLNSKFKTSIYFFNSFVLFASIIFGIVKLGGGGYEDSFLGIIIQWIWLVSLPITAFGLNTLMKNSSKNLIRLYSVAVLMSLISVMVFTLFLGRRSILFVVITIAFFWCKSYLIFENKSYFTVFKASIMLLRKLKLPITYFYGFTIILVYKLLTSLINSYQVLRISSERITLESIYNSFIVALVNNESIADMTRNEAQAGRLMLLSSLAQLISRYRFDPISFRTNSLSEFVDPFLNAIPADILKILTGISKSDLLFGENSLASILGYKIDFIDVLSATSFTGFEYLGLVFTPIILFLYLNIYFYISFALLKVRSLNVSGSFVESYKYLSWLSLIVYISVGGYTDAALSTYFRSLLLAVFIAFLFSLATNLLKKSNSFDPQIT